MFYALLRLTHSFIDEPSRTSIIYVAQARDTNNNTRSYSTIDFGDAYFDEA